MERAPAGVGIVFGVSLAALIVLAGPLLLFNPWTTSALQQRNQVADALGARPDQVDRATGAILADLVTDGSFAVEIDGEPLLNERERSHMHDVAVLVRTLAAVAILAAVLAAVTGAWLRGERHRLGRVMVVAAGTVGTLGLLLAGIFAVAFEPAFLAFHELFFPPGTYLFEPGSRLITLFPQGFWFEAALLAGIVVVLSALAMMLIGLRLWRGGRTTSTPA